MSSSGSLFGSRARITTGAPGAPSRSSGSSRSRRNTFADRATFSITVAAIEVGVILVIGFLAGLAYQRDLSSVSDTMKATLVVAVLFAGINVLRADYAVSRFFTFKGHAERLITAWFVAFGAALTIGFMTKASAIFSRGTIAIVFVVGVLALLLARRWAVQWICTEAKAGRLTARTAVLVGSEDEIDRFLRRWDAARYGLRIIGGSVLRDTSDTLDDDLALALATTRMRRPDDVFLLMSWRETDAIRRCIDTFRSLPVAVHLGTSEFLETFEDVRIDHIGPIASVHVVRSPLSPIEVAAKRALDILVAATVLVLLSPLLLLVGAAIKIESRGPVLFRQRRYGFNQEPFRIIKFRSMTTMEDNANLVQVTVGDKRVTRLGRILRRTSIDELPQLINVLKGDMSLVGPRPHALAHDQKFERMIARYARRHNVRPGITGWAQVNGWRGETDTPEKIAGRVEHDLHYIDNWSLWLDLSILVRTAVSPRTFRNAR